jgi:hypothetical protein
MHILENIKDSQFVYEDDPYSLHYHCVELSLSENILNYLLQSSLLQISIHMEEVKSLIS